MAECANARYPVSVLTTADLDALIADIEAEMARIVAAAEDERTKPLYDMVRYHLGLDDGATRGKRIRPLLGLLAYQSISGDYERALPGAAAVELGHNFSLVHDDIEDGGTERRNRPRCGPSPASPRPSTRATRSSRCRAWRCTASRRWATRPPRSSS